MRTPIRHVQILANTPADANGGGARHARLLARGLRQLGLRVSMLATGNPPAEPPPDFDEVHTLSSRGWSWLWRLGPLDTLPAWTAALRQHANHADGIISLSPVPAVAAQRVCPDKPRLFAPAILDRVEHPGPENRIFKWFEQRALAGATGLLVRTPAVRRVIEQTYGVRTVPFATALPGVDVSHAQRNMRDRAALGVPADARLLLTVGLINENKGQHLILDALRYADRPDWFLAIVGDGPARESLQVAIADTSLAAHVKFVGHDRAVGDWYTAADVFVLAARHECLPQSVVEALAAGLPVVIPEDHVGEALSPMAPHVEQFDLGATFRRGNTPSLAIALARAVDGETPARATCRQAWVQENLRIENYARAAVHLLTARTEFTIAPSEPPRVPAPRPSATRLSVVIPTCNRSALLHRAIESVLNQTAADRCDIVVVDDGSTDDTPTMLARLGDRVNVLRQQNQGPSTARNVGVDLLPNRYVAFLDDDDVWRPTTAERLLATWDRWPDLALVTGRSLRRSQAGLAPGPEPRVPLNQPTDFAPALFEDNFLITPAMSVRRDIFLNVGGFAPEWRRVEDYHLWVRLACRGPGVYLDEVLTEFAVETPNSLTKDDLAMRAARLTVRRALRAELTHRPDCRTAARRGYLQQLRHWRDGCARAGLHWAAWRSACRVAWAIGGRLQRWEWGQLLHLTGRVLVQLPRQLVHPPARGTPAQ